MNNKQLEFYIKLLEWLRDRTSKKPIDVTSDDVVNFLTTQINTLKIINNNPLQS